MARSEVKVRLGVVETDTTTGRQIYDHETVTDPISGSVWDAGGIFADPKDLQALAQTALSQTIDQAIDAL